MKVILLFAALAATPPGPFGNGTALVVTGIPYDQNIKQHVRPATPGEVTAILYTKDGKRWRAKWEEAK